MNHSYIYLLCVVVYMFQLFIIFSNSWYKSGSNSWGLNNSCTSDTCTSLNTSGLNKAILYTCRILLLLSSVITLIIIGILALYPEKVDWMKKLTLVSLVSLTLVLLLSLKFKDSTLFTQRKLNGKASTGFFGCILVIMLVAGLLYILEKKYTV